MVSRVVSLTSSALIQISLLKEPSETLDDSMTFDFPMSVCSSKLALLVYFSVFVVRGVLLVSAKVFGFFIYVFFLGFVPSRL